jgi:hypothetical protein
MKYSFATALLLGGFLLLQNCTVSKGQAELSPQSFVGKSVGDILSHFNVSYDSVVLHDEPPGKLSSITFSAVVDSKRQEIELFLLYNSSLFSTNRKWDPETVKKTKVLQIEVTEPQGKN